MKRFHPVIGSYLAIVVAKHLRRHEFLLQIIIKFHSTTWAYGGKTCI